MPKPPVPWPALGLKLLPGHSAGSLRKPEAGEPRVESARQGPYFVPSARQTQALTALLRKQAQVGTRMGCQEANA